MRSREEAYGDRERLDREQSGSDSGFIGTAVKIGAGIAAVGFLGRTALGRDAFVQAMGYLGRAGRNIMSPIKSAARGALESAFGVARSGQRSAIESFELLDDLAHATRMYQQLEVETGRRLSGNPAYQAEIARQIRTGLRARGYAQAASTAQGNFRSVTVGDIFASTNLQSQIDSRTFGVLRQARQAGYLTDDFVLHRGRAGLRMDPSSAQGFVDVRFMSPRVLLRGAYNALSNIQVPFVGFRPVDLVASVMRPFSEGVFAGRVGRGLKLGDGVSTPGGAPFVIGGKLRSLTPSGRFVDVANDVRLFKMGQVGRASLERHGNAVFADEISALSQTNQANLRWWQKLQLAVGVGRPYRTQDQVFKALVGDPIARQREIEAGRAAIEPFAHVSREAEIKSQGFFSGLKRRARVQVASSSAEDFSHRMAAAVPSSRRLKWADKAKAIFGIGDRAAVATQSSRTSNLPITERIVRPKRMPPSANIQGRRAVDIRNELPPPGGATGYATSVPIEHYPSVGGGFRGQLHSLVDVGHYMTNRLNSLIGATFGIGFKPMSGRGVGTGLAALGGNIAKIYGIHKAGVLGLEALNYGDFLAQSTVGQALPEGIDSPKKMLIRLYQGATLARAWLRETLGLTGVAQYAEQLMPGSMDSGLSFLARTAGPVAGGLALGGLRGGKAGLAVSALIGGSDVTESTSDIHKEFTGEKLVAVRKGRFWGLGRQPYEGGQIDYFRPHWTVMAASDYKYTDTLYGSKSEYFANVSRLPNLHNFLGLKTLFQSGGPIYGGDKYLAEKHRYTRPYPDTPGTASAGSDADALVGPESAPVGAGYRLGFGAVGGKPETRGGGVMKSIGSRLADLSELTGAYKFLFWDLPGFERDEPTKMASYTQIGSEARAFYDMGIGGAGGLSEFTRRFVLSDDAKQGLNFQPNQAPDWLPGNRSIFDGDRFRPNRFDFHAGDPFAKVAQGEARLPGQAYESLHSLHSGVPGVYSPVDRMMILADVAPQSEAYKHYKTIVDEMGDAGVLSPYWAEKTKVAKEQVRDKLERYKFYHRRFTGLITDPKAEEYSAQYSPIERAIGAGWEVLTHDVVPAAGDSVPLLGPLLSDKLLNTKSPVEHYLRYQVHGNEFADWNQPWQTFFAHRFNNLAQQNPGIAAMGGLITGYTMGASPLAGLALGSSLGVATGAASIAERLGGGGISGSRARAAELDEWFENIQYVKARMLENRAVAVGDGQLRDHFVDMRERSLANIDYSQAEYNPFEVSQASLRAMDRVHRGYFPAFLKMPKEAQNAVLPQMPEQLRLPMVASAGRLGEARFAEMAEAAKMSPDQRAAKYFTETGGLPSADWAGWHPSVPMDVVRVKFLEDSANGVASDIHQFDLQKESFYRASPFADMDVPVGRTFGRYSGEEGANLERLMLEAGFENPNLRLAPMGRPGVTWSHTRTHGYNYRRIIRER